MSHLVYLCNLYLWIYPFRLQKHAFPISLIHYIKIQGDQVYKLPYSINLCIINARPDISLNKALGKPQKMVIFLVARPLRPLTPPPLGLVAIGTFFLRLPLADWKSYSQFASLFVKGDIFTAFFWTRFCLHNLGVH